MSEYSNRLTENDLDLGPIEERLAAANPGPWKYWEEPKENFTVDMTTESRWVAKRVWDESDAIFIANAPTDITALIAEVKRLREVEETLRDRIDQMEFTCEH